VISVPLCTIILFGLHNGVIHSFILWAAPAPVV